MVRHATILTIIKALVVRMIQSVLIHFHVWALKTVLDKLLVCEEKTDTMKSKVVFGNCTTANDLDLLCYVRKTRTYKNPQNYRQTNRH